MVLFLVVLYLINTKNNDLSLKKNNFQKNAVKINHKIWFKPQVKSIFKLNMFLYLYLNALSPLVRYLQNKEKPPFVGLQKIIN